MEVVEDAHMPGELALPVMSNQKMNDALKILFKHAGLDKPITRTYFAGRKTFVVIGLSNDISPYTITAPTRCRIFG